MAEDKSTLADEQLANLRLGRPANRQRVARIQFVSCTNPTLA